MTKLNGTVLLFHSKRLAVITEPVQVRTRAKDIEVLVNPTVDELIEAVKVFKDYHWEVTTKNVIGGGIDGKK